MTITGWVVFGFLSLIVVVIGICIFTCAEELWAKIVTVLAIIAVIAGMFFGMRWYFHNTASGQRQLLDQQSNLNNGIERTVTVYTADGEIIAQYTGKIDIEANDGGYVKFDFDGKRYIYYNCFVETVADIE